MKSIAVREASGADVAGIFQVRTSVTENSIDAQRLERMGIVQASIASALEDGSKAWVAEQLGRIVAFSIAHQASQSVFALFVLPEYERRGLGSRLLNTATEWLWDNGADIVWLTTEPNTRSARFYETVGWTCSGLETNGELRFERRPPKAAQSRQGRVARSA